MILIFKIREVINVYYWGELVIGIVVYFWCFNVLNFLGIKGVMFVRVWLVLVKFIFSIWYNEKSRNSI